MKRTLRAMIWLPLVATLCCGTAWAQDEQADKPSGADAFRAAYKPKAPATPKPMTK